MVIGTTLCKGDGNPYHSPSFPRGGLAAVFAAVVTHVFDSPNFTITVEHRNQEDTGFTTLGDLGTFSATSTKMYEASGIKEVVRFKYAFDAEDDPAAGVHFQVQLPSWRPYP